MSENLDHHRRLTATIQSSSRPLRLTRNFAIACALGVGIVMVLIACLANHLMTSALVRQESLQNTAFARTLINQLAPQYFAFVDGAFAIPPSELADKTENVQLQQDITRLAKPLNVVKIRIYSSRGQTVFSNWPAEIGTVRDQFLPVERALKGEYRSSLGFERRFEAMDGSKQDRHVVSTYIPFDNPVTGKRHGVLEIHADVTTEVDAFQKDLGWTALLLLMCMGGLYFYLLLFARKAESHIEGQYFALNETNRKLNFFARVVEQSKDSIITRDLDGVVTTWNEGAESIFGYSKTEAVGKTTRDLNIKDCTEAEWRNQLHALRAGLDQSVRGWHKTKDGQRIHLVTSAGPLKDESGRLIGDILISHDTTWLKRAQEELRRAKNIAEAAARNKGEFLANMSHEIRTPMNGIIGMANLALDTALDDEQRDYLTTLKSSADSLRQIINDILDFSKIEAGKLHLENTNFQLRETIDECVRGLAVAAHEKHLELIFSVARDVPDSLNGDSLRIRQILINLVGNAIKFTSAGEVEIRVQRSATPGERAELLFRIRDTGIGIAPDKLESIFNAFEQSDASTTRRFGGAGLGLSISRQLVQLMGGTIGVESTPGVGSTFSFSLRFETPITDSKPSGEKTTSTARDLSHFQTALIVEDNAYYRHMLCQQVASSGLTAKGVESVEAVVAAIAAAQSGGQSIRLIIIDGQLLEAGNFALAVESLAPEISSLILADTTQGKAIAYWRNQLGVQVLVKPVSEYRLLNAINDVLVPHSKPLSRASAPAVIDHCSNSAGDPLRVLLVEDNAVNRKLATRLLERLGHHVAEAHDGVAAVTMLSLQHYDVVLMDMQMPVMDGLEATRAIRTRENGAHRIPIIALTANAMSGDRERCIEAGMDDYVSKPIEVSELVAALGRVRSRDHKASEPVLDIVLPCAAPVSVDAYDRKEALGRAGGDQVLLAEIIEIYLTETPPMIDEIDECLKSGDKERAFRAAHTVKGSSANLSAEATVAAAKKVELAIRNDDLAAARAAYPELCDCAAVLIDVLTAERKLDTEIAACA